MIPIGIANTEGVVPVGPTIVQDEFIAIDLLSRRPPSKRSASASSLSEEDDNTTGKQPPRRASLTVPELTQIGEEITI